MKYNTYIFYIFYFSYFINVHSAAGGDCAGKDERAYADASTQTQTIDPALLAHQVTTIINIKTYTRLLRQKQRILDDLTLQAAHNPCRWCIPKGPSVEAKVLAQQIKEHRISVKEWQEELQRIHKELPYRLQRTIHDIL
ncbi:hypothetical protein EBQ93_05020 [bacterium]|nr:hypothetical protein [bacterium]